MRQRGDQLIAIETNEISAQAYVRRWYADACGGRFGKNRVTGHVQITSNVLFSAKDYTTKEGGLREPGTSKLKAIAPS